MRFHAAAASRPEGPAAPSVFSTVLRINCPSITSDMTGCGSGGCEFDSIKEASLGGCSGGFFFSRTSRTVSALLLFGSTTLSNGCVPVPLLSVIFRRAARTFPYIASPKTPSSVQNQNHVATEWSAKALNIQESLHTNAVPALVLKTFLIQCTIAS